MKTLSRLALVAALPLALVACGDDSDDGGSAASAEETAGSTDDTGFPVTVGTGDSAVELAAEPQNIVSLSPTATEMLFAIGAGDKVVAADSFSNYPEDAPTTELSGFEPNVEAISDFDPDLVVASDDPGELVASLDVVGVPTLILPGAATLDDSYAQLEQLGAATGQIGEAAEVVAQMRADIDELVAEVPADAEPITYFHELDPNLYTVTSSTFVGEIYGLAGMASIADEAGAAGGDYPQLAPEHILTADPEVIFFADGGTGGVVADDIAARPGWDQLTAVQQGHIVELDPDIASRWGPRVVDYLRLVVEQRPALAPAE